MTTGPSPRFHLPASVAEASAMLADYAGAAAPLAGATWLMRAPLRGEAAPAAYVAVGRLPELRGVEIDEREIRIGAAATHAEIAARLSGHPEAAALVTAAARSANPAIREVATLGGNLAAADFAASDLVPALLGLDADVELAAGGERQRIGIAAFLARRSRLAPGELVAGAVVRRSDRRSAHARLPLRSAGDYPVAVVSLSAGLAGRRLGRPVVAVGSVEAVARRWDGLEAALDGWDGADPRDLAASFADAFRGRNGVEAPGWYRVKVLPALVARAVAVLRS